MAFSNTCLDSGYTTLRDIPSVEVDQCTVGEVSLQLRDTSDHINLVAEIGQDPFERND